MGLVSFNDLVSFVVHTVNIIFIPIIELVHLSNQVISLVCKSSQILFKPPLLVLRVHGPLAHHFELLVQISQSMAVTFVLSLELAQLVILS